MTDVLSTFTEVDEQKIGIAVELIPRKMAFLAITAQTKCILEGESTACTNHPLESNLLSEVSIDSQIADLVEQCE